ncbi:MAG: hypothetical protein ABI318_04315 [Chthoniobacteraceae bacterium]
MNPTQDIPQDTAPATPEQPVGKPPEQPTTRPQFATDGTPPDLRNLALGAGLLLSAFLIFWMGLYLPNHVALRTLVASFGTFALVWVLYRVRIFRRPHGGLIAAGSVALFAAVLPFVERMVKQLDSAARTSLAGETVKPADETANTLPVPTRQSLSEAPVPRTEAPQEDEPVRELIAPAPDPSAGKLIRVMQDAKVSIHGRKFLIRSGSEFPLKEFKDGTVTFQAGSQEVTINADMIKFIGKSMETPAQITKLAEFELMRRYPAVGKKDSPENELFLERIKELKVTLPELFNNPRWPFDLGEQLAVQEGWKRADALTDENTPPPATSPQPPANAEKDSELPVPAIPPPSGLPPIPPVPQDAPPPPPK